MNKTVIFDWDGCLAHSLEAWLQTHREVVASFGVEATDQAIIDNIFHHDYGPEAVGIKEVYEYWSRAVQIYQNKYSHLAYIHEGVVETLAKLRSMSVKNAIVSRTDRGNLESVLKRFPEVEELLDAIIVREDVEKHKPDPEAVYKVMNMLNSDRQHTFIIGDSEHDVLAGKNASIKTILFYPPHNEAFYSIEALHALEADYTMHKFEDLIDIVAGKSDTV